MFNRQHTGSCTWPSLPVAASGIIASSISESSRLHLGSEAYLEHDVTIFNAHILSGTILSSKLPAGNLLDLPGLQYSSHAAVEIESSGFWLCLQRYFFLRLVHLLESGNTYHGSHVASTAISTDFRRGPSSAF